LRKPYPGKIKVRNQIFKSIKWLFCLTILFSLELWWITGCKKSPDPDETAKVEVILTGGQVEMVRIPAGNFTMGSNKGESDEQPARQVKIDAFLMDRYEVTQQLYKEITGESPSRFKGDKLPVEQISWARAAIFCNKRSVAENLEPCYNATTGACDFSANGYRLPTEAEWEYASRAGSTAEYTFGDNPVRLKDYAWFKDNSGEKTHPVGTKRPNAWGLYDMYGNISEWCNDYYEEHYYQNMPADNPKGPGETAKQVLRGGAFHSATEFCRSAYRSGEFPGQFDGCFARDDIGFRCVRKSADDKSAPADTKENTSAQNKEKTVSAGTGFLYDDIYLEHQMPAGHPERPERLKVIVQRLQEKGLLSQLALLKRQPAEIRWLLTVHTPEYVKRVEESCQAGEAYLDSPDTPISAKSYEVAVAAVGGVLAAVDAVAQGRVKNVFCAIRPPGHHALKERAMGFCIFNNIAIAARYAQQQHHLAKVLIVDWDVHHGNGTQEAFYDDPNVMYFGVHQYPFYPGSGAEEEKGSGAGLNYTINVPLPAGAGDREFQQAFAEKLTPAALSFKPDIVLISAGFDAQEGDLLGGMKVSTEGFAELTRMVKTIAEQCCRGRVVSILEGGYNLELLPEAVEAHIRALL